jgi:transcriptional regulator with XRE-family HTH domain
MNKKTLAALKGPSEKEAWKEIARWRAENIQWLEMSFSIALYAIDEMDRQGITQKELAARMKVSPQQVNKILKGSENITLETIAKLNQALGIQLIEINSFEAEVTKKTPARKTKMNDVLVLVQEPKQTYQKTRTVGKRKSKGEDS